MKGSAESAGGMLPGPVRFYKRSELFPVFAVRPVDLEVSHGSHQELYLISGVQSLSFGLFFRNLCTLRLWGAVVGFRYPTPGLPHADCDCLTPKGASQLSYGEHLSVNTVKAHNTRTSATKVCNGSGTPLPCPVLWWSIARPVWKVGKRTKGRVLHVSRQ
jgi:hypothetical protein